jgi:hypothetical protein
MENTGGSCRAGGDEMNNQRVEMTEWGVKMYDRSVKISD